jgi:hypothetical protein
VVFGLRWHSLLVASGAVFAQSNDDPRVQRLEETVRALESRVAALEAQLRERSAPANVAPDKVNWRKLRNGMSEDDVAQLLGSPSKVDANPVYFIWYYGYPIGGHVDFHTESRKVEGWREP